MKVLKMKKALKLFSILTFVGLMSCIMSCNFTHRVDLKTGTEINNIFRKSLNASDATSFKASVQAPAYPEYYLDEAGTVPVWYDSTAKTIFYYSK